MICISQEKKNESVLQNSKVLTVSKCSLSTESEREFEIVTAKNPSEVNKANTSVHDSWLTKQKVIEATLKVSGMKITNKNEEERT